MKSFIVPTVILALLVVIGFIIVTGGRTFGSKSNQTMKEPPENVTVRLLAADGSVTDRISVPSVVKSEEEWRTRLTAEQYAVARSQGTEQPFCGVFHDNHKVGVA